MLGSTSNYRNGGFTRCGRAPRAAKTQSARNGGFRDSVFQDKDSPDYRPNYGKVYTDRQKRIINEELPVEDVSNTELVKLLRKAEALEDLEIVEKIKRLHALKNYVETYHFSFTPEEAAAVLQELTPWQTNWDK